MNDIISERRARALAIAELTVEVDALGEAALVLDWEEARFRSFRIMGQAFDLRAKTIAQAGHEVFVALGPPGGDPGRPHGGAFADLMDAVARMT